jgi:hypothetical protein
VARLYNVCVVPRAYSSHSEQVTARDEKNAAAMKGQRFLGRVTD